MWIGFDQPKKIKANAQGGILVAPAWTAMMKEVYERRATPSAWPRPETLAALDIDRTTGYKATPFCPKEVHYIESFIPGTEPVGFCPVHSPFNVGGTNPLGGAAPLPGRAATAGRLAPARRHARRDHAVRSGCHAAADPAPARRSPPAAASWAAPDLHRLPSDRRGSMPAVRLSAGWVLPVDAPPIERGAVLVGPDGFVERVGPESEVPPPAGVPRVEAPDAAIVPGLVNAHTHLELTGFDGLVPEDDFVAWITRLRELKEQRPREAYLEAAKQGVRDCWASGVTTVADTGDRGVVARAIAELGGSGHRLPGSVRPPSGPVRGQPGRAAARGGGDAGTTPPAGCGSGSRLMRRTR